MKKKLFLGALLLGALTLNSCVDNVESDSVKAVRQAKAEQLQAKAGLDKANAEAALILANAEKMAQETAAKAQAAQEAYLQAQAEYQRALAEREKAQAEYYKAQTETEKARAAAEAAKAELAAQQAQIDLETAQAQLEKYKQEMAALAADWEKQLYENQIAAMEAKKKYEDAIKNADKAEIAVLMAAYQKAADDLLGAQKALATTKMSLAQYEAGLISANETAEREIKNLNDQNAQYQGYINEAQAYIDTYRNTDYATAEAALEEATKELSGLKNTYNKANTAKDVASTKETNAKYTLDTSEYQMAIQKVCNLSGTLFSYSDQSNYRYTLAVQNVTNSGAGAGNDGNWCAIAQTYDNYGTLIVTDYIPLFSGVVSELKYLYFHYTNNATANPVPYTTYSEYYNLISGGMDKLVKAANEFVTNGAQKNFDNAKKNYEEQDAKVTKLQGNFDTLSGLKKTYDDAVKAKNDATADEDGKLQEAIDTASDAFWTAAKKIDENYTEAMYGSISNLVNTLERNLNNAKNTLTALLSTKNARENTLNDAKKQVANIEGYATTLKAGNDANTAAVKAYNEASVAKAQAEVTYHEADNDVNVKRQEISALNNIVNGYDNNGDIISSQITQKESSIEFWTAQIESNKTEIEWWQKALDAGTLDQQNTIDNLKADIANQEAKVVDLENKVKEAKAELDAALGTEETPAE